MLSNEQHGYCARRLRFLDMLEENMFSLRVFCTPPSIPQTSSASCCFPIGWGCPLLILSYPILSCHSRVQANNPQISLAEATAPLHHPKPTTTTQHSTPLRYCSVFNPLHYHGLHTFFSATPSAVPLLQISPPTSRCTSKLLY